MCSNEAAAGVVGAEPMPEAVGAPAGLASSDGTAKLDLATTTLCITNVQRYSLHDGGGIRTVVFCKGCPFRCPWCCNPENLSFTPEVSWKERLCIGCAMRANGQRDANGCPCDTAPDQCPTGAKELMGTTRTLKNLLDEVERDLVFYEESGGGVTLSGGEALAGPDRQRAVTALLAACHARGIQTAIESTLATPLEDVRALAEVCDIFLIDFKIADRTQSLAVTGIDPAIRDENIKRIQACGGRIVARLPIIPGYTDDLENVRANARRACELGIDRADILPFHQLGEGKYDSLGMDYQCRDLPQLTDADMQEAVRVCEEAGLKVVIHGE